MRRVSIIAVLLLLLLALVIGALPGVQAGCAGNALPNGDFEAGFSERGSGEVTVANQWTPYWQDGPDQDKGMNRRPEYKAEDANRYGRQRVKEGNYAQKWGNNYATHHGGVYQRGGVPAGSQVSVHVWAQAWSSEKDDPKSVSDGAYGLSIGLDPTGGADWTSSNIIWSERNGALNTWVEFTLAAQAQGDAVTIYLRGDAEWPVKHNDAYFDDVCLTVSAPQPTAKPTSKPQPTNPPAPKPSATPETEPTEAPTEAAEAPTAPAPTDTPATGALRVVVFEDKNGNGLRDADEPLLPNARITLLNMQRAPVASHTTQGGSEQVTFASLAPGDYILTERDPDGYESTSPNEWAVTVLAGAQKELTFGDRAIPVSPTLTAEPSATPLPPTEAPATATPVPVKAAGRGATTMSGLLVAALAVLLLVAVWFMRARE